MLRSPDTAQALSESIRRRQPRTWPLWAYFWGWIQALLQLGVFATSLWLLQVETRPLPLLALSLVFGWAWFCLLMVGHDAMHHAFVPGRALNRLVAFLTLDCLLFSRTTWLHGHHIVHHARPFSTEDGMFLRARSVPGDLAHLLLMVLKYLGWDLARLVRQPRWDEWLGMTIRVGMFWCLMPFALLPAVVFLLLFGSYLGLLPHALPVARKTSDPVLRQLRTSWDLYPGSFIASFLTGGLNAHATHHIYPSLPRGAQSAGSRILREEAGEEYRTVNTLAGLWALFRLRTHGTRQPAPIEAIAAGLVPVSAGLAGFMGEQDPSGATARRPVADLRVGERRTGQMPISFPDRRRGERRGAIAHAAFP